MTLWLGHSDPKYRDYTAVVSLPHGSSSAKKSINNVIDKLKKFKDVILSFDMDKPGRDAVKEVCTIAPFIKSIDIPAKDANDCILEGKTKALYNTLYKATRPKNSRLILADTLFEAAKEPAREGELSWPWSHIQAETRGIRYGETIYLGAGVKMGKSEIVNALGAHFIKEHDAKVFMAKPEEENKKTVKMMAGKMVGRIFHDPKVEFDYEAYDKATSMMADRLMMIDLYQHMGWETLKSDIYDAVEWGAKAVFIDPITNLTAGTNSADANTQLEQIAQDLSVIAKDLNIVVFIFCHLKSPEGNISKDNRDAKYKQGTFIGLGNCPHEFGGDIYSNQFAGSRAMMRSCNMMIGIEGNKDDTLSPSDRNVRVLKVLEDREFGITGRFGLYWNSKTSLFEEL